MKDKMLKKKDYDAEAGTADAKARKLPANYNEACEKCDDDHDENKEQSDESCF